MDNKNDVTENLVNAMKLFSEKTKRILGEINYDALLKSENVLADYMKKYCNRLYFTFWGGEWTQSLYLGSNKLFQNRFNRILKNFGDGLVNGSVRTAQRFEVFGWKPVLYHGALGSAPLERIFELVKSDSRALCKNYWKIIF